MADDPDVSWHRKSWLRKTRIGLDTDRDSGDGVAAGGTTWHESLLDPRAIELVRADESRTGVSVREVRNKDSTAAVRDVVEKDRHVDGVRPTRLAVVCRQGQRIAMLPFEVVYGPLDGAELTRRSDRERCAIRAPERVGQRVAIRIRGRDHRPDGHAGRRILRDTAGYTVGAERGRPVAGHPRPRFRPGGGAFITAGPHLHRVRGVCIQRPDFRRRARLVENLRPHQVALGVAQIVRADDRPGVHRRRPGDRECVGRSRLRGDPRRRRSSRRLILVGQGNDHRRARGSAQRVLRDHRDLVGRPDLEVEVGAELRPDLGGPGVDPERSRGGALERVQDLGSLRVRGADRVADRHIGTGILAEFQPQAGSLERRRLVGDTESRVARIAPDLHQQSPRATCVAPRVPVRRNC